MTHFIKHGASWTLAALVLGGCTTALEGPSVMALPGTGHSFDQFRADDSACRAYAYNQLGGQTAVSSATTTAVGSALVGTALGAAIGAVANGSQGAGTGAAIGLGAGTLTGAGLASDVGQGVQRRYDNAYVQCMYAKGNRVPVNGTFAQAPAPSWTEPVAPAAPSRYRPPPPPGLPPAPPPDSY